MSRAPILVRDAPGGEDYAGNSPGNYLAGTGGGLYGTVTGGPFIGLAVGTYDLEADYGSGYQSLRTYCLEATQYLAVGTQPTITFGQPYSMAPLTSVTGISTTEATYLEILWANAFADSQTGADKAAAFQMIVWEFQRDNTFDLAHGTFRLDVVSDAVPVAIADGWYGNITNHTWTSHTPLAALVSPHSQDLLVPLCPPVPEPVSVLLLGFGGAALAYIRWRGGRRQ